MKHFPDGRTAELMPLTFGRSRIIVSRDRWTVDDGW